MMNEFLQQTITSGHLPYLITNSKASDFLSISRLTVKYMNIWEDRYMYLPYLYINRNSEAAGL